MAGVHDLDHITLDLGPTPSDGVRAPTASTPAQSSAVAPSAATAKLEPYLLLAKSARGAAAAKLVGEAMAASGVHAFGELLEMKGVAELENSPEYAPHHALLKIFAYGTWQDYRDNAASLPPLNAAQEAKLKRLSIVSLASTSRMLSYDHLMSYLQMSSVRQLEELVIEAIYADVFDGRLDQKNSRLEVESCMGRDVKPVLNGLPAFKDKDVEMADSDAVVNSIVGGAGSVQELRARLSKWSDSIGGVLNDLDAYIASTRQKELQMAETEAKHDAAVTRIVDEITASTKAKSKEKDAVFSGQPGEYLGLGGTLGAALTARVAEAMDIDDVKAQGQTTNSASRTRKRNRP